MRMLVDSLKRLYESETINLDTVKARVTKGTITEDEFKYITGVDYTA